MLVMFDNIIDQIITFLQTCGPIAGILVIILESMIPILPLAIFIAFNILSFGPVLGFIISWFATVMGCMLSFWIMRKFFRDKFNKRFSEGKRIKKILRWVNKVKFPALVIIVALPFTPAFAINIAAGLSNISKRKFLMAMLIGKPFMVYFWAYIGSNIKDMITNPTILLEMVGLMAAAYGLSLLLNKRFKID